MKLEDHNFTTPQILKIYEFLQNIDRCNKPASNCKIDGISMFKDRNNDFYTSYALHTFSEKGLSSSLQYVKITQDGETINLNMLYSNTSDIIRKLEKATKITIE